MPELSERVLEVFDAIVAYKQARGGVSPGLRDLCALTGYQSTSTVSWALDKLEEAGLIAREPGQARSIEVTGARWIPPEQVKHPQMVEMLVEWYMVET